jgi:hypothetical protein
MVFDPQSVQAKPDYFPAIGFLFTAVVSGIAPQLLDIAYHTHQAAEVIGKVIAVRGGSRKTSSGLRS